MREIQITRSKDVRKALQQNKKEILVLSTTRNAVLCVPIKLARKLREVVQLGPCRIHADSSTFLQPIYNEHDFIDLVWATREFPWVVFMGQSECMKTWAKKVEEHL